MVTSPPDALALLARLIARVGEDGLAAPETNLAGAIRQRDTAALYRALLEGFSYQGISDQIARDFIALHGGAEWHTIEGLLQDRGGACPKLVDFDSYRGCAYRKAARSCGNPAYLADCPVPGLPLRKGVLNEQAFSLYLFIRDRCDGDLVGYIDRIVADNAEANDPVGAAREALLGALCGVVGVSRKLASMMLATLLMADAERRHWSAIGHSMIAVDSLVHNFLHRTGILHAHGRLHPYGPRCFSDIGCEPLLRELAGRLSHQVGNDDGPSPRTLQHAIWRFCAGSELGICNGNRINDEAPCELFWCPLWSSCGRVALRPPLPEGG